MIDILAVAAIAGALTTIGAAIVGASNWITAGVKRDVDDLQREHTDLKSQFAALNDAHSQTNARVIRTEVTIANLEKTLERVERTITDRFDDLKESLLKK